MNTRIGENMYNSSPILNLDSYKLGHIFMYPEKTEEVYANLTPRSLKRLNVPQKYKTKNMLWIGGQAGIRSIVEQFTDKFFSTTVDFDYIKSVVAPFAGANYPTEHLEKLWKLGYLPLEIKTLDEGNLVPENVPVLTIRNTHKDFAWLPNWLETWISNEVWHISTSATIAYYYRKIGQYWYEKTGANMGFLDFAFHDFSLRGQTSMESGIKSATGHLSVFMGSDVVPAVPFIKYFYGAESLIAASVPASEHSVQTSYNNDYEYIRNVITNIFPTGIVSLVVDGYDYWNVITNIAPALKKEILARGTDEFGLSKVVFRPDSGDPVEIICGKNIKEIQSAKSFKDFKDWAKSLIVHRIEAETPHGEAGEWDVSETFKWSGDGKYYNVKVKIDWNRYDKQYYYIDGSELKDVQEVTLTPEEKGSIELLWEAFGGTINEKGYKVLNPHVGLIYGDSITMERAEEIFNRLEKKGFSADNIVFGIGSYTYQYVTRDTLGFAIKATNVIQNGKDVAIFKAPKTDDGTKKSAKGLLKVVKDEKNGYKLIDNVSRLEENGGELTTLFKDGVFHKHQSFDDIRKNLRKYL